MKLNLNKSLLYTAVPIAVLSFSACGQSQDSYSSNEAYQLSPDVIDQSSGSPYTDGLTAAQIIDADRLASENNQRRNAGLAPIDNTATADRQMIVEINARLLTTDISKAVNRTIQRARILGGSIDNSNIYYGDDKTGGQALLVFKMPPEKSQDLIDSLKGWGTVESVSQSSDDVTEQLVDLEVRITNARRSLDRIRVLLDDASDFNQLILLENELTTRQVQLEQLLAAQQGIKKRVVMATVTVEIYTEPKEIVEPEPGEPGEGLLDSLERGWESFTETAHTILRAVFISLPYATSVLLLAALSLVVFKLRAKKRKKKTEQKTPDNLD